MQNQALNKLRRTFFENFSGPYTGSLVQWLTENVVMDNGEKFNIAVCPWLKEVYEAIHSPDYDLVILQGATGTFKTGVQDTIIPWFISQDPGPILRVFFNDDVAKDFAKTRLLPMLNKCKPVAALCQNGTVKTSGGLILFPHMEIKSSGPSAKIQYGWSCRVLQIDEAHVIDVPFQNLFNRVRKNYQNTKIIITSTCGEQQFNKNGEMIGDQLSVLVNQTTVKRRAWKCPHCQRYQVWRWSRKREDGTFSGINYVKSIKKPDGSEDDQARANTAMLECHHCRKRLEDTEKSRMMLEQTAIYETIKEGNPRQITFQVPAWSAPFNSYRSSALQYIKAKDAADAHLFDLLREFHKQVATEEWNERIPKVTSKLTFQRFATDAEWPEETCRFMGVDVQGNNVWYFMVVAFDAVGNGRIIKYGVAHSWLEIEQNAVKYKVQQPDGDNAHFVGVDCGYEWSEVAKETVRHGKDKVVTDDHGQEWTERFGWLMLRGEQADSFLWEDGIKRVVSPQKWCDTTADSSPARQYFWSNKSIKNLVASIRDGHNKLKLTVNTQDETLERALYSEYPDAHGDWKEASRKNHLWDCLCMCYALGILAGVPFLGVDTVVKS